MRPFDKSFAYLLDIITAYNPVPDYAVLRKAHDHAAAALEGLRWRNGEPAFARSLCVAHILAGLRVDETAIAAGLLLETALTAPSAGWAEAEMRKHFEEDVAAMVGAAVKLHPVRPHDPRMPDGMRIHALQRIMSQDIKSFLVALADHLHTMRLLDCLPAQQRERLACHSMEIYLPLAHRLRLRGIEHELEALCFRHLQPEDHDPVQDGLEQRLPAEREPLRQAAETLRRSLEALNIQALVRESFKNACRLHEEVTSSGLPPWEIVISELRITVQDKRACYEVFGLAQNSWKTVPGSFQDHFAAPANDIVAAEEDNGQGLQATVIGPTGMRMELSIRTVAMDDLDARGMLASWWNREGRWKKCGEADWSHLLGGVPYLSDDAVYVFTFGGDIRELPQGATPVDFAYAIHTEVGNRCVGAKINGRLARLDTRLRSGDSVQILCHAFYEPCPEWLRFVKTDRARRCIRRYWHRKKGIAPKAPE